MSAQSYAPPAWEGRGCYPHCCAGLAEATTAAAGRQGVSSSSRRAAVAEAAATETEVGERERLCLRSRCESFVAGLGGR
eukprot:7610812-Prorocentrum_lima.AAC.1